MEIKNKVEKTKQADNASISYLENLAAEIKKLSAMIKQDEEAKERDNTKRAKA